MNADALTKVSLRYNAVFCDVDPAELQSAPYRPDAEVMAMAVRLAECGFALSEELMHALAAANGKRLMAITKLIEKRINRKLNWMPLVKNWNQPTGETIADHIVTHFANMLPAKARMQGTTLPCGHFIPQGTFPLERYNGCPYCGTPFRTADFVVKGQGGRLKLLSLFTLADMDNLLRKLMSSPVPLDATQFDSLKRLAAEMDIPADADVPIIETRMALIGALMARGKANDAVRFFSSPNDILRFLWYEKTGKTLIIRPKYIINNAMRWIGFLPQGPYFSNAKPPQRVKMALRLKYNRAECRCVAAWLDAICTDAQREAEIMHPYRGMWVRFIRALRLAEFSRKKGFERLKTLMDVFYRQDYTTWRGQYDKAVGRGDGAAVLEMLSARPGMFARCLFATMLRFGTAQVLAAFGNVAHKVTPRLLISLANAAQIYFSSRTVRYGTPITGGMVKIEPNKLLAKCSPEELEAMAKAVWEMCEKVMRECFAAQPVEAKTIYIEPKLFDIPLGVADRSTTIQDFSCALQGTRFQVYGDKVRLFLQWGVGLPAQHLDMDLSAIILYDDETEYCNYLNLVVTGAKHSGDIRSIPEQVGTAEYVDLDLVVLRKARARYVVFACNAYSYGRMPPRLQVGWMSAEYPMEVHESTGVAYDPACVQHMVRVADDNMAKGIVFGVLDVASNEITWLELQNMHQASFQLDTNAVTAFLQRLRAKYSVGKLLTIKAEAQGLQQIDSAGEADCAFTYEWALSPANVNGLLSV